jgi:hypothetical protein
VPKLPNRHWTLCFLALLLALPAGVIFLLLGYGIDVRGEIFIPLPIGPMAIYLLLWGSHVLVTTLVVTISPTARPKMVHLIVGGLLATLGSVALIADKYPQYLEYGKQARVYETMESVELVRWALVPSQQHPTEVRLEVASHQFSGTLDVDLFGNAGSGKIKGDGERRTV